MLEESLRASALFYDLSDEELQPLVTKMRSERFGRGQYIVREGERGDKLYFIETGRVKVSASRSAWPLCYLGPGDFFGEMSALLPGYPRTADVVAVIETEVRSLSRTDLEQLLLSRPQIALRFNQMIVERTIGQPTTPWSDVHSLITVWGSNGADLAVALAPYALKPQPRGQRDVSLLPLPGAPPVSEDHLPHGIVLLKNDTLDEDSLAVSLSHQPSIHRHTLVVLPDADTALARQAVAISEVTVSLGEPPAWLRQLASAERLYIIQEPTQFELERLARDLAGLTVGVALSSGGSRGLAHLTVLTTLREAGVPIDMIAGSSLGAFFGACFATGWPEEKLREIAFELNRLTQRPQWYMILRGGLGLAFQGGLLRGRHLRNALDRLLEGRHFSDLEIPMVMVAADVETGRPIEFDSGPLADAIRASMSLPGIFAPWRYQGHYCMDGGITNPLPADVLRDRGIHVVIASNATHLADPTSPEELARQPSFLEIVTNMQFIAETERLERLSELVDVSIDLPGLPMRHAFDFTHAEDYLAAGREAARARLLKVWQTLGLDQYVLR
ncbi:MAG: patatin-like phospholipase family protein [Anaerolineae bacterium]